MQKIPILLIRFANNIRFSELPLFRGAIIDKVSHELTLFHNHTDDGLRYQYPLIQYKRINSKAVIVCIGNGTEEIGNFFANADFNLKIGEREEQFEIEAVKADQWIVQTWDHQFTYTLRKWLPLNQENYSQYQQLTGLADKIQLLERILTGNILSMCTGLNVHLDKQVQCQITDILATNTYRFKGVQLQGFDIRFTTNVYLHDYIALGKAVSHGFGVVKQMEHKPTRNEE